MTKRKAKAKTKTTEPASVSDRFVSCMQAAAAEYGVDPSEVTTAMFAEFSTLSEWELRKAGSFRNLQRLYFPKATIESLSAVQGTKLVSNHRNALEREYGRALYVQEQMLLQLGDLLKAQPIKVHAVVKPRKAPFVGTRTLVAAVSDTHFGANISNAETHGLNEFNWTIASRRLGLFMSQIVGYKPQQRNQTDLVIQLNGDIIAGLIHNQEWFVDLLTTQFAGSLHLLSQAISFCAQHFRRVTVVCTPGNHGRSMAKSDKGRATTHKWDSYENMVYLALKMVLAKHTNVTFTIPEAPFAVYQVQGHTVFQTHGDTVLNVGNPGKSLNMAAINEQVNKISSSKLLDIGDRVKIVSVGHVHVPTTQMLDSGCMAVINGCLSGVDPFAQSIGVFDSNPTQLLFEATPHYAVGDIRMVSLKEADVQSELDAIIEPFKGLM